LKTKPFSQFLPPDMSGLYKLLLPEKKTYAQIFLPEMARLTLHGRFTPRFLKYNWQEINRLLTFK